MWLLRFEADRASSHPGRTLKYLITVDAGLLEFAPVHRPRAWIDRSPFSIVQLNEIDRLVAVVACFSRHYDTRK